MSWHRLCHTDELAEREAKAYQVHDVSCFIIKFGGAIYAYLNACPHRKIELEWQENAFFDHDKDYIQCATHGALFLPQSGHCIAGPCQNQSLTPLNIKLDKGYIHLDMNSLP